MASKYFDSANLRLRLISAAILMPVVLLAVYLGGLAYGALATCVVVVGLYEWLRLISPALNARTVGIACALMIFLMTVGLLFSISCGLIAAIVATLILFLLALRDGDRRSLWTAFGIPYLGGSGLALLYLRFVPDIGTALVFYLLVVVWSTDSGAFIAGRLIGGRKLAPIISPSKTWAGLFGGMVLALILGYLAASLMQAHYPLWTVVLSPLLAVVAQMGDLFESAFKRRSGAKESGDIIPGHGGILDRIDGLVFAGIFLALFEALIGVHFAWW